MNKTRRNKAAALRRAGWWLAVLTLFAAVRISSATGAHAQQAPPGPGQWQHHPQGQMGAHPPMAAAAAPPPSAVPSKAQPTASGEQFFLIASVDQAKSEILLKRADEVTELVNVTPTTKYSDESSQPLKLSDLRAGDTVWVKISSGAHPVAVSVRKGQMTIADLHRYYLDYPEIR